MEFEPVYSARFTDEHIRNLFFEAKYEVERCDFCNSRNVYFIDEDKKRLRCKDCWKRSSLTHNTYLESTKLSLRFWYEVIWSFVLDHSTAKTRKLLQANNHQKILRIYRTLRQGLQNHSDEKLFSNHPDRRDRNPEDQEGKIKLSQEILDFLGGNEGKNHPIYAVYELEDQLYLKLLKEPKKVLDGAGRGLAIASNPLSGATPVGFGCLFHGKGEYVDGSTSTQLEGLWNFTKSHMQVYQGIRRENWSYYLKEIEFKYNNRKTPFKDQASILVEILMNQESQVTT